MITPNKSLLTRPCKLSNNSKWHGKNGLNKYRYCAGTLSLNDWDNKKVPSYLLLSVALLFYPVDLCHIWYLVFAVNCHMLIHASDKLDYITCSLICSNKLTLLLFFTRHFWHSFSIMKPFIYGRRCYLGTSPRKKKWKAAFKGRCFLTEPNYALQNPWEVSRSAMRSFNQMRVVSLLRYAEMQFGSKQWGQDFPHSSPETSPGILFALHTYWQNKHRFLQWNSNGTSSAYRIISDWRKSLQESIYLLLLFCMSLIQTGICVPVN